MMDNLLLVEYKKKYDERKLFKMTKKGEIIIKKILSDRKMNHNLTTYKLYQDIIWQSRGEPKYFYIDNSKKLFYKYGEQIQKYMSSRWKLVLSGERKVDYSNKNSTSSIQQGYLDGLERLTDKYELAVLTSGNPYVPYTIAIYNNLVTKPISFIKDNKDGVIFMKEACLDTSCGRDVVLYDKDTDINELKCMASKSGKKWVIQREIYPPALLNDRKFDLRIYVFGIYLDNTIKFYVSKINFAKTTKDKYVKNSTLFSEMVAHLLPFKNAIDLNSHYFIYDSMTSTIINNDKNVIATVSMNKISKIIIDTINLVKKKLNSQEKKGFILLGYDISTDIDGKVYLIEINQQPYIDIDSKGTVLSTVSRRIINTIANNIIDRLSDNMFPLEDDVLSLLLTISE